MSAEAVCRELMKLLGPELVRCHRDTVDYFRRDTHKLMKEMNKEVWSAYYEGSLWVNELKGVVGAGDVVVPTELEAEMVERLKEFGCSPAYVHRHPEFRTSHIHLSDCHVRGREGRFCELITG